MKTFSTNLIVSRKALWFGLLGGATAWMVQLFLVWAIAEFGCVAGLGEIKWMGITVVSWMAIVASLLMLVIGIVSTWVAYRSRNRIRAATDWNDMNEAAAFMANTGFITSGIFVLIIIIQSVPILFFLRHC
ncbi:MAG: hypothetical protein ACK4UN_06500 [Limisphaerales bacterium]